MRKKYRKKLPMDGFDFSYLPISWPAADNSDGRAKYAEIFLSTNEMLELRQYYKHRLSVSTHYRVCMQSWLDYSSMNSQKGAGDSIIRELALRKVPGDVMSREDLRKYIQLPEAQQYAMLD